MLNFKVNHQIIPNIQLVIFDKDGTLFDIHHYWVEMIRMRAKLIAQRLKQGSQELQNKLMESMGVDLQTQRLRPEGPVGVKKRTYVVTTVTKTLNDLGFPSNDEWVESCFKEVDELSSKNIQPLLKLLPGVVEFIEAIYDAGATLAIATTDNSDRAIIALESAGIAKYFRLVVGADMVKNPKPAPDIVRVITEKLHINAENSIIIGDHQVDLDLIKNAGLRGGIGVSTGLHSLIELNKFSDTNVETLREVEIF